MRTDLFIILLAVGPIVCGEEPPTLTRCEALPMAGNQVALQVDGVETTRWHFGGEYPRPFFFPFNGPSGTSLTRMGHPGAPNHDHHRSVWFAHQNVAGIDFWSDRTEARIRQKSWYCYGDADDESVMASSLGWYDAKGSELLEQDLVAALLPLADNEHALEIQVAFRPGSGTASVELGKTNFGFLAVRVAKTISEHFGGGKLSDSEGRQGETAIFGNQARWMDYSGSIAAGAGAARKAVFEGITYFDHPTNPRYPTYWHVRSDGWMGAAFCLEEAFTISSSKPLRLRYLLHAHRGICDQDRAEALHRAFAGRPGFQITPSKQPHRQFEVERTRF